MEQSDGENQGLLGMGSAAEELETIRKHQINFANLSDDEKRGVLQTLIRAGERDEDRQYRQTLLLAVFGDQKQARMCAGAIDQMLSYGADPGLILDAVITQCAVEGARINSAITGITHLNMTSNINYEKDRKNSSKKPSIT